MVNAIILHFLFKVQLTSVQRFSFQVNNRVPTGEFSPLYFPSIPVQCRLIYTAIAPPVKHFKNFYLKVSKDQRMKIIVRAILVGSKCIGENTTGPISTLIVKLSDNLHPSAVVA